MTVKTVLHILNVHMTSENNFNGSAIQTLGNQNALQLNLNFMKVCNSKFVSCSYLDPAGGVVSHWYWKLGSKTHIPQWVNHSRKGMEEPSLICVCVCSAYYIDGREWKKEALKCHHSKNLFGKFCSRNLSHNIWDELTPHRRFNSNVQDFQSGAFQVPT